MFFRFRLDQMQKTVIEWQWMLVMEKSQFQVVMIQSYEQVIQRVVLAMSIPLPISLSYNVDRDTLVCLKQVRRYVIGFSFFE